MATNNNQYNDFNLSIDGYAAFDALSLKNLIIKRLNSTNNYTDQRFEGSNLSSIIDIVAYAYHVLLFYLNRTSSESTFTTAELYENVNKIVKLIGYNPIGKQTAILPFKSQANNTLPAGTYTIPRYSYFNVNGTTYSFNSDTTFTKITNTTETLADLQDNNLLYQGSFTEYPSYFANGAPFEVLTITVVDPNGGNVSIDHFNIYIYVKDTAANAKWVQWAQTQSLFLERSNATKYEIRLNENGRYEIKFGNNINGQQLNTGAEVAIYYLQTNGQRGEIGPGLLNNKKLLFYNTAKFNSIKNDTISLNSNLLTTAQAAGITFSNIDPSTKYADAEDVTSIKNNAPNTFKSQFRLITADDFINHINKNYSNIIASTQVVNNWDYISGHLKYYFDIGVAKPDVNSRVLFNQVKFADSSNFNNVYIYAVPKLAKTTSLTTRVNYLNSAQKQLIINDLENVKLTTAEIIVNDPVYVEINLGVSISQETLVPNIGDETTLVIQRAVTSKRDALLLKQLVAGVITDYFATTKDNLGLKLSVTDLTNQILAIEGVDNVTTQRTINGATYTTPGVSFIAYNPVYPYTDIEIYAQDVQLPYFKYPYLKDSLNFINKISVITPSLQTLIKEY
jgi:hypothetical protein